MAIRRSNHIANLMNLIDCVMAMEEWEASEKFHHDSVRIKLTLVRDNCCNCEFQPLLL